MLHSPRFHHWRRHGTWNHSLSEAIGRHAERQVGRELLKSHGLAQMCHLLLPAAIQPGMSPWVHQEQQRPNTNDSRCMRGNSIGRTLDFIAFYTNTFHRSTIHFASHFSLLSSFFMLPSLFLPLLSSPLLSSALISLLYTLFLSLFYS